MKTTTVYLLINDKELISLIEHEFYTFSTQIIDQSVISVFLEKQYAVDTFALEIDSFKSENYIQFIVKVNLQKVEFLINTIDLTGDKTHIKIPAAHLEIFNENIIGKVQPIHVAIGDKYDKGKAEELIQSIQLESDVYKYRLETFLETKSRKIIPFNYFDSDYEEEEEEEENSILPFDELKEKAKLINTVDEAVDFLIQDCFSPKKIEEIKDQTIYTQIYSMDNHFGINMYLRNLFFHGNYNTNFKKSIYTYEPFNIYNLMSYGEKGEGLLSETLWRRLNGCELGKIKTSEKIIELNTYIDNVYERFYKEKGLDVNNLSNEDRELVKEDVSRLYHEKSIGKLTTKILLLSYEIDEENMENYLMLDAVEGERDYSCLNNIFEMHSIIGEVKKEEYLMFEHLKKEYLEIYDVYKQLGDFIYSKE